MSEIKLYHGDCMDAMKKMANNQYDLAIVDPEYGRNEHGGTDRSGNVKQKNGKNLYVKNGNYKKKKWDKKPVDLSYLIELIRVSKNQIIWGINYYNIALTGGRIVWDKVNYGSDQSDCEIAYNSLTDKVDIFRFMWRGMMQGKSLTEGHIQQGNKALNEKKIHPTQKPVLLYKWLLQNYAKPGDKILDTHGGSMSIAIAAHDMGFDLDLWEIDKDYYEDGLKRYNTHIRQLKLFA